MRLVALLALASALAASDARSEEDAARIREGATSSPVAASKGWSYELERELMSPYCPGRSLIECPSPQATELRLWIQAQEQAGVSRASVEERLFQRFGEQLSHSPRAEGWGLLAYLVPAGALLVGGVFVAGFLRRQGRPSALAAVLPPGASTSDPALQREIDRELAES